MSLTPPPRYEWHCNSMCCSCSRNNSVIRQTPICEYLKSGFYHCRCLSDAQKAIPSHGGQPYVVRRQNKRGRAQRMTACFLVWCQLDNLLTGHTLYVLRGELGNRMTIRNVFIDKKGENTHVIDCPQKRQPQIPAQTLAVIIFKGPLPEYIPEYIGIVYVLSYIKSAKLCNCCAFLC